MELSARALDILIALSSNPNEVVSKTDLLSRVWPDVTVEEGSLRFHIANLRKALGDGQDGARYITTIPGRGYCFVAPISRSSNSGQALDALVRFPHANLHGRMMEMVGRDDDVFKLSALLNAARFVTGSGRETLQVEGEHVYRLDALACPPDDTGITAAVAQTFAAPKLFVERAAASGAHLDLSDAETAIVVCICAGDARRCIFRRRRACHLMFTRGNSEAARVALNQSLAIAQQRRDAPNQLQLLSLLHMFHHRIGDFKTSAALSLPRPLRLHPPSRSPIPLWGVHSTISAISAAPAWSLRQRYSVGRTISGPARSISTSNTTITPTSP